MRVTVMCTGLCECDDISRNEAETTPLVIQMAEGRPAAGATDAAR